MKLTVVSISRIEGGTISSGSLSGISFPFSAAVSPRALTAITYWLTSVDQTHGDVELGQIQLASVIDVRQRPERQLPAANLGMLN
jgi:hypothetical protein